MNFANLPLMAPEAIVAVAVLLMVILDLVTDNKKSIAGFGIFMLASGIFANFFFVGLSDGPREIFWSYAIDGYSCFFKYLILAAGIITLMLAVSYKPMARKNEGEFYFLLSSLVFAMMCLVSATDLILIYVCIEFISLTSYILVGMLKNEKSSEGALKYFLIGAISSGVMVFGMSYVYGLTGSTNIITIAKSLAVGVVKVQPLFVLGALFMLVGFSFKTALAPLHFWSPDAYEGAPTPVTAILSVGPKCAAFAVFGRVFYTIFPDFVSAHPILITSIGALTMTLGNTAAIWQTDIKRMFAYSSIAQAGYIFIGIAAGTKFGFLGLLFYLMAYIFMNLGAFGVIVLMVNRTGSSQISSYAGLSKTEPFLAASFLIFFLALAGIPPTSGFLGKYFLFTGALATKFYVLALFGVVNSVISAFYYFAVVKLMYFVEPASSNPGLHETNSSDETEAGYGNPGELKDLDLNHPTLMLRLVVAGCLIFTLVSGMFPEALIRLIVDRGVHFLN